MPLLLKLTLALQLLLAGWAVYSPRTFLAVFRGRRVDPAAPPAELRPIRLLGIFIAIVTVFWYLAYVAPRYGWW